MASYAFLYVNHGEGLHVGGEHNAERLDGDKNTDVPNDRWRRDVIWIHCIVITIINTQALAPEDDASTVLPQVVDGDISVRVVLPCDRDGTVRVHGGFLAAQNGCRICVRLDLDAMLPCQSSVVCINERIYTLTLNSTVVSATLCDSSQINVCLLDKSSES